MKKIAIYGAGGFGREVACLINKINEVSLEWNIIGFFDDGLPIGKKNKYGEVLGGLQEVNAYPEELSLVMAIASPKTTEKIVNNITSNNICFPNIISPDFMTADKDRFSIGRGNVIQGNCWASCDVSIGDFNVLNGSVVLGHNDIIGSHNTFMAAVRVSGEVIIGDCNFFGVGSIILQQLKLGNNIRIGAGSVLMTKPKDGCLYIGVPAKKTEY